MWYFGGLFISLMLIVVSGFIIDGTTPRVRYSDFGNVRRRPRFVQEYINFCGLLALVVIPVWMALWLWDTHPEEMRIDSYNERSVVCDTMFIQSAALNSELSGTFYLGFGSIGEDDVYKFYRIVNRDSYVLTEVPAKWARIQEVDSAELIAPHVVSHYYTEGYIRHNRFIQLMLNRDHRELFRDLRHIKEHVIFVPRGTIVSDVSELNLK